MKPDKAQSADLPAQHTHHGGAWKVAYADFVTAMMALFMILWIAAQEEQILLTTSQYFASPFNSPMDRSSGVMSGEGDGLGSSNGDDSESADSVVDMTTMNDLAREFYRLLDLEEAATEDAFEVQVNNKGLFITVYDQTKEPLFTDSNSDLSPWGKFVIQNLSWLLDRHNMSIQIGSHVEGGREESSGLDDWELTAIRANVVRQELEKYALDASKVDEISAFGSSRPLDGVPSEDKRNQRIEINLLVN